MLVLDLLTTSLADTTLLNGLVVASDGFAQPIIDAVSIYSAVESEVTQFEQAHTDLMSGTEDSERCYGWNDTIDQFNLQTQCDPDSNPVYLHDLYECTSIIHQLGIFKTHSFFPS